MLAFPHTFTPSHLLYPLLRGQQMEKPGRWEDGESTAEERKCFWTWPVSNRHSSDRCSMFTKQTSDVDVREMKTVTWGCATWERKKRKERKPGVRAGIFARALEVFQGRQEDCVPHQHCKSVSQNLSHVTSPEHPRQLWLLARAIRGHCYWWAVFKSLTSTISFHLGAQRNTSRITIKQNTHLELSSQTWKLPLGDTAALTSKEDHFKPDFTSSRKHINQLIGLV